MLAPVQKTSQSIFLLAIRFLLFFAGIFLLMTILPHSDPWRMDHVIYQFGKLNTLKFHLPAGMEFEVPRGEFLSLCIVIAIGQIVLSSGVRQTIHVLLKQHFFLAACLFATILFLVTLLPGLWVGWMYTKPVTVYLILGWCSFVLILGNIYPLLCAINKDKVVDRVLSKAWDWMSERFRTIKLSHFLIILFAVEFVATNAASYFIFEHIPHIQDSIAQVFHGMIFAVGKLTVPSPPLREFFDFTHVINNGQWYSQYPLGHSFLMMLGVLINAPWIINPLTGAVSIVLFYFLGEELYNKNVGRLAALFGLFSPFILFMSSEFMNHASAMFFFGLFALFFAKTLRTRKVFHAIVAGIALGWLINIRPMTAFALAIPFLLYGGYLFLKQAREYLKPVTIFFSVVGLFVVLLLGFNYLTNGSPFLFGYEVLYGSSVMPGFGNAAWGGQHTLTRGIYHALDNLVGLNKYLFEWPIPSLIPLFLLFCTMPSNRWDYILLSAFVGLTIAYVFYWYQDWCFGPRFLYEATPAVILLSVRGLEQLPTFLRDQLGFRIELKTAYARIMGIVVLFFALGLTFHLPALINVYSDSYWGVNAKVLKAVEQKGITKAVIFTRSYYGSVFTANSPLLDSGVIYVKDLGESKNRLFMQQFPGYAFYLAEDERIEEFK